VAGEALEVVFLPELLSECWVEVAVILEVPRVR
jgi:hypothetical protein